MSNTKAHDVWPNGQGGKKPAVTVDQVAETVAAVVDSVNPGPQEQVRADQVQIQVDPQMLQQATQMKNARLIASLVHESAMLEVVLEQSRREAGEWKAKHDALRQALSDD